MESDEIIWEYIEESVRVDSNKIYVNDVHKFSNIPKIFGFEIDKDIMLNLPKSHHSLIQVIGSYGFKCKGLTSFVMIHDNCTIQFVNGMVNSINDLPALTLNATKDNIYRREWYRNNLLHRDNDLPSVIEKLTIDHFPRILAWYNNGILHRERTPALVRFATNGILSDLKWYENGKRTNLISDNIDFQVMIDNLGIEVSDLFNYSKLLSDIDTKIE